MELLEQEYLQEEAAQLDTENEIGEEINPEAASDLETEVDAEVEPEEDFDVEEENLEGDDENLSDMELPDVELSEDEIEKEIEALEEEETETPEDVLKQQEQEAGQIIADMNHMLGKEIERHSNENAFFDEQIAKVTEQKNEPEEQPEESTEDEAAEAGDSSEVEDSSETEDSPEIEDSLKAEDSSEAEDKQETRRMPDLSEIEKQKLMRAETRKLPEITLPEEEDEFGEPKNTAIKNLSDELKSVFSYFVPVKGMEGQLCQALTGVRLHFDTDSTSGSGNLIIQGGHGCGKTVLATSVIKALQKVTGRPNGRIGKIDADALNKKDIQQLLRKVAGGCLIIENAGNISRQTAVTLSLLLEHDTSGVLIILEDTSKGIKKALTTDDGFAKKFTEKINVPIFTNDELVSFARSYSRELAYEIDEMAVLALYNRISNIQRLDQATTLTEVKEIVDGAIDKAERGGIKKAFSILTAKRYTEDDRVILRERDFED